MNKTEKIYSAIRDDFTSQLDNEFKKRFRRNLTTEWNFLSMQLVSRPTNGKPFTATQKSWVDGYSSGYGTAMDKVKESSK